MRHNVAHRKLGRITEHRRALLRNQAIALLRHERIETTMPKAKELRPFVERLITIARRGVAAGDGSGRTLHARRLVLSELPDREVVGKLFETLAPRFMDRPGGYTRILRVGFRRGDSAEVAQIELVGSEYQPQSAAGKGAADAPPEDGSRQEARGVGARIKRAAQRMRGSRRDETAKGQAKGQTRGATRKSTAPRKAGGS
jgi:large subunit ribosomal protein L17